MFGLKLNHVSKGARRTIDLVGQAIGLILVTL